MSHTVPSQHPAVVLRANYQHLRALLVIAIAVILALTIAVLAGAHASEACPHTTANRNNHPTRTPHTRLHRPGTCPDRSADTRRGLAHHDHTVSE